MSKRNCFPGLMLVLAVLICSIALAHSGTLYWSTSSPVEPNGFFRANLDGGDAQLLPGDGVYFTLDPASGKRYWHDIQMTALMRSNLDGSLVEELYEESSIASDLDLDPVSGKVYAVLLAEEGCGFIFRRNLDGSNFELLLPDERARGLSLDLPAGKMYWADQCGAAVKRSNLDGSDVEVLVVLDGFPSDLALDLGAGKIYWTRSDAGVNALIERSNLDGTGVETVLSTQESQAIALDLVASKLYWSEPVFDDVIRRSDLDGSNVEVVISDVHAIRLRVDAMEDGPDVPASGGRGLVALCFLTLLGSSLVLLLKQF